MIEHTTLTALSNKLGYDSRIVKRAIAELKLPTARVGQAIAVSPSVAAQVEAHLAEKFRPKDCYIIKDVASATGKAISTITQVMDRKGLGYTIGRGGRREFTREVYEALVADAPNWRDRRHAPKTKWTKLKDNPGVARVLELRARRAE